MSLRKSPTLTPSRHDANRRNAHKSTESRTARGKAQSRMNSLRSPISCEGVKKRTISRKDAKAQRLANDDFFVFFAPFATLPLCVKCFCSARNYFARSCGTGQGGSRTARTCAQVICRTGRRPACAKRESSKRPNIRRRHSGFGVSATVRPHGRQKKFFFHAFKAGMLLKTNEA